MGSSGWRSHLTMNGWVEGSPDVAIARYEERVFSSLHTGAIVSTSA
ncbi:hypothetical protein [Oscillatoria acuminata]|nr:hypothetical protein [Oscillatoria acuminata]